MVSLVGNSVNSDVGSLTISSGGGSFSGLVVTPILGAFSSSVVPTIPVLFLITGVAPVPIPPGIVMFPTSEDIISTSNNIISGSSKYYTIGTVYWNSALKVQGVDWEFVTPADHPSYTHMIRLLVPPTVGTSIRLLYNAWDIQVQRDFIVTSYPVSFKFYNTTIIADILPSPSLYFTVQYFATRQGVNPQSLLARYPIIYDDILTSNTLYDNPNGFETDRPIGYQVYNTGNNHVYKWDGTWIDMGLVSNGTQFYIKRSRTIFLLSGGIVTPLYITGSGSSVLPQVLTYPLFGEGVAYNLFLDATQPGADINYPASYEIYISPGDYDPWVGT
jgi:hypothetical protein